MTFESAVCVTITIRLSLMVFTAASSSDPDSSNSPKNSYLSYLRNDKDTIILEADEKVKQEEFMPKVHHGLKDLSGDKINTIVKEPFFVTINKTARHQLKQSHMSQRTSSDTGSGTNHVLLERRVRKDAFEVTQPEDHPYAVMLFIFDNVKYTGLCSGSIVSMEWVLTAASHCFRLDKVVVSHVEVYAGGNSEKEWLEKDFPGGHQLRISSEFYVHPNYSRVENYVSYNDVALVKVDKFTKTSRVAPIRIHTQPWEPNDYYTSCTVTGFGKRQFGDQHINEFYRKTHYLEAKSPCPCLDTSKTRPHNWICSKPVKDFGICEADWGAALVCEEKIRALAVVVMSYQNFKTCTKDDVSDYSCAQDKTLSIFQNTFPSIRWMNESLKRFKVVRNQTEVQNDALSLRLVYCFLLIPSLINYLASFTLSVKE